VAGLALAWLLGTGRMPSAQAQAQPHPNDPGTVAFAVSAQAPDSGQYLYLIDTKTQAFAVYKVDPRDPKGAVKLEGARQYRWDLRLAEFNNQEPQVATIESMVSGSTAQK
jgi:hypothetical protein